MVRCSLCGGIYSDEATITLHNVIHADEHDEHPIHLNCVICKDCIGQMYDHVNKEETTDSKQSAALMHIMFDYFEIYLKILDYYTEDKETVSETDARGYLQALISNINKSKKSIIKSIEDDIDSDKLSIINKFLIDFPVESYINKILKTIIEDIYSCNEYQPLPVDVFRDDLCDRFSDSMDEFSESLTKLDIYKSINEKLAKKTAAKAKVDTKITRTPSLIKKELDKYVIGQEKAKKTVAVGIYNHYKRIESNNNNIKKSNIMLVGATGSGKTEIARTVAKILDVPFAIADATSITEAGYVGEDAENMLLKLIQAADGDVKKAERGIIYIDEIDKIARESESRSVSRDVGGEGVQQALLKIVEGNEITINRRGNNPFENNTITINTENILFICGGAFENLTMNEHVAKQGIGFNSTVEEVEDTTNIDSKLLIKSGLIPELVGRFPIIAKLNPLTKDDLKRILVEPENSVVKQYKELFSIDNIKLDFTDAALQWIANKAYDNKTGARGLKSIIEDSMLDIMYEIPDDKSVNAVQIGIKSDKLDFRKKKI